MRRAQVSQCLSRVAVQVSIRPYQDVSQLFWHCVEVVIGIDDSESEPDANNDEDGYPPEDSLGAQ